jgi:hypothetical protein
MELWHVANKHPRTYQSPTAMATIVHGVYYATFLARAHGATHSVKGLREAEKAEKALAFAEHIGCPWALCGDVSAWDTSWGPHQRGWVADLLARIVEAIYVNELMPTTEDVTTARGRLVSLIAWCLHRSGDSDNTATNGLLHFALRSGVLTALGRDDWFTNPQIRITVEGDDGLDQFPLTAAEIPAINRAATALFHMWGFDGGQSVGWLDASTAPLGVPLAAFCSAHYGRASDGSAVSLPTQPRALIRSLSMPRATGPLAVFRRAKAASLAELAGGAPTAMALAQRLGRGLGHVVITDSVLDALDYAWAPQRAAGVRQAHGRLESLECAPGCAALETRVWHGGATGEQLAGLRAMLIDGPSCLWGPPRPRAPSVHVRPPVTGWQGAVAAFLDRLPSGWSSDAIK